MNTVAIVDNITSFDKSPIYYMDVWSLLSHNNIFIGNLCAHDVANTLVFPTSLDCFTSNIHVIEAIVIHIAMPDAFD